MADVKLTVNDKEIPLNPIMNTIITNINLGLIEALNGIPEDKQKLNIEIIL